MINDLIRQWGREKGINNPDKQTLKLVEEVGELVSEICHGHYDTPEVKDALGDIQVVLIILADILGMDLYECKKIAYNVISKRTGKTVDGCFIKKEGE